MFLERESKGGCAPAHPALISCLGDHTPDNIFGMDKPPHVHNRLRPRLRNMLAPAKRYFPVDNKSTVSKLKVEKVLNPPSRPVVSSSLRLGAIVI